MEPDGDRELVRGFRLSKEEQVLGRGSLGGPGGPQPAAASPKAGEGRRILLPRGHKAESSRRGGWLAEGGFDVASREKNAGNREDFSSGESG